MVRRSAAVLGALGGALAWFLAAPALPEIDDRDLSVIVAAAIGFAFLAACITAIVPLARARLAFVLILPGAVLLMAALDAADVGAAATPVEALVFASAGVLFARALATPSLALALPVVVAVIDAVSVAGGGPERSLTDATTDPGDPLTLELPDVGSELSAGRLGLADAVFFAIFAVFAQQLGMRPRATVVAMTVALIATFAGELAFDTALPALPALAIAYFLVNADRVPALFRRVAEG